MVHGVGDGQHQEQDGGEVVIGKGGAGDKYPGHQLGQIADENEQGLAAFAPEDPVKYDFALTRFGIHPVVNKKKLPVKLEKKGA